MDILYKVIGYCLILFVVELPAIVAILHEKEDVKITVDPLTVVILLVVAYCAYWAIVKLK